jgi:hypothetical protein
MVHCFSVNFISRRRKVQNNGIGNNKSVIQSFTIKYYVLYIIVCAILVFYVTVSMVSLFTSASTQTHKQCTGL